MSNNNSKISSSLIPIIRTCLESLLNLAVALTSQPQNPLLSYSTSALSYLIGWHLLMIMIVVVTPIDLFHDFLPCRL